MVYFWFFVLLVVFFGSDQCLSCPQNCDCSGDYQSECWLEKCEDDVVLDEKDFLLVHGKLCVKQRSKIAAKSLLTLVVLYDDNCDHLHKCRTSFFVGTTLVTTVNIINAQRKPMIPPGHHEDAVEFNQDEEENPNVNEQENVEDENENLDEQENVEGENVDVENQNGGEQHNLDLTTVELDQTTASEDLSPTSSSEKDMTTVAFQNIGSRKPA